MRISGVIILAAHQNKRTHVTVISIIA